MRIDTIVILFWLLALPNIIYSQPQTRITKPQLELLDNGLIISYEIQNSNPSDIFKVWLVITDEDGNIIQAKALSGDFGDEVRGGKMNKIVWDLEKDEILIDKEVFIEVIAEKKKQSEDQKEISSAETDQTTLAKPVSKTNMVISSVVLPGWGLSKAKQGKPYWLLGVAGYGCIAGSIYLNRSAINTYDEYKLSMDADQVNTLYDKAVQQNNISKILGYSAAGIWAVSMIWTIATPTASKKLSDIQRLNNINIQPLYNQKMNCAMLSISYKF
ncbi:hypothetical protein ES705_12666 [subsurface metagenome]